MKDENVTFIVKLDDECSATYGVYHRAMVALDFQIARQLVGPIPENDLDPPSYLPMQPREAPRVPDLCPDGVDTMEHYHPGGVRPEGCHCPECFTKEDAAELDKEWAGGEVNG